VVTKKRVSTRSTTSSGKDQAARFREAAKKAEVGDAKEFERAFKKVVKPKAKSQSSK
jgi:hypothetical protein